MVTLISRNFVPVATDLRVNEKARQFLPTDIAREIQLQHAWNIMRYRPIGMHVVSPSGALIASEPCVIDTGRVLGFLQRVLQSQPRLPQRNATPAPLIADRGIGVRADGSARLAVTIRPMDRGRPADKRPVLDSILFTAAAREALTPPNTAPGTRYSLPALAAREFVRALTDMADLAYALRAQDATQAQIQAEVESNRGGEVLVSLHGMLAGERRLAGAATPFRAVGTAVGLLTFDRGGLQRMQIVCDGQYAYPWVQTPHATGGLIEWRAASH